MKNISTLYFILIIIVFLYSCKNNNQEKTPQVNKENHNPENNKKVIDMDAMKEIIAKSSEMNMDVFFAISVYHKYYVSKFSPETAVMSEDKQKVFYEKKRIEFFKSIKYTEKEYNSFMETNKNKLNNYLNDHPEIANYLISTN